MLTIREIIRARDDLAEDVIDFMFQEFAEAMADGEMPDEQLRDIFGLEPDYLFDDELMKLWSD